MIYQIAVSFALGILAQELSGIGWTLALAVSAVSLAVFSILRDENGKKILICALLFSLGMLRMELSEPRPDPYLERMLGEKISLEAQVTEEPDRRDSSTRYTARPIIGSKKSGSSILLVAGRYPELEYGDRIKVSGRLDAPENFMSQSSTEFDYVSYLSKDGIHFLMYEPRIEKEGEGGSLLVSALYRLKERFMQKISAAVPEPSASFLGGAIFGAKQSLGEYILDDFKRSGLIHIVVLSGYNITIIAAGVFALASGLGRRRTAFMVSAFSIALFSIMVGLGATVMRAGLMALIALLARYLGRPSDALRWLFIAGFLMLLWNPLSLYRDPSFQLSFMATLGLILLSPHISSFISKRGIARFVPEAFGLREIISSTMAVQISVLPLLIKMSGQVSIVSFLANPVVLPLVPYLMASGALTGALGFVPVLGKVLSWPLGALSHFLSFVIISAAGFSSRLPLAVFEVGSLPLPLIALWYLSCALIVWPEKIKSALARFRPARLDDSGFSV